jgi:Tol biopolymer transport system component
MEEGERSRWREIKALFDQAAALPPAGRKDFLENLCSTEIAAEVLSLLEVNDRAGGFLERPAAESMETPDGRVGNYRILREIGRGGSSIVYLAERADGRFQKRVAVKILGGAFFGGEPHRLFERERQLLAEMDHPNIVRLWDGGITSDARPYLVEDFVDGSTITEYARQNDLTLKQRLELFLPVCDAVQFVHDRAIIHRDLKPHNILATAAGVPKLVDFGIARPSAQPGHTAAMWTPAYGAPELARGERATPQSDIYSLGMVLAELLMDRPAIDVRALDPVAAARAICERQPDLRPLPAGLAAVIGKALRKNPAERHSSAAALAGDLRAWLNHGDRLVLRLSRYRRPVAVLGAAALLTAAAIRIAGRSTPGLVSPVSVPITADDDLEGPPCLSRDGGRVVYTVTSHSRRGIWLKDLDTGESRMIAPIAGRHAHPAWLPDGSQVLFAWIEPEAMELRLVRPGEQPRSVLKLPGRDYSADVQWTGWAADGRSIHFVNRKQPGQPWAVFRLSDGRVEQLSDPPQGWFGDRHHAMSPDGRWLALGRFRTGTEADIYLMPASGGEPRRLTFDAVFISGISWTPDSSGIVYAARRAGPTFSLWQIGVAGSAAPKRIAGIEVNASWPSIAPSPRGGMRIAYHFEVERVNIRRWDDPGHAGSAPGWVARSTRYDSTPQYSPDGRWIAFASSRSGFREIWLCDENGGGLRQLSFRNGGYTDAPRWSPDGKRIAFSAAEGENRDVYVVEVDSGSVRRMTTAATNEGRPSFSADGRWLYFRSDRSGSEQIWKMPAEGGEWIQVTRNGAWEAIESLDGRWLYFARNRPARGLWRMPPGGGAEEKVLEDVREGLWGLSNDAAFYIDARTAELFKAPFGSSRPGLLARISVPIGGIYSGFSVRADGRSVLFPQTSEFASDVMLLDGAPLR